MIWGISINIDSGVLPSGQAASHYLNHYWLFYSNNWILMKNWLQTFNQIAYNFFLNEASENVVYNMAVTLFRPLCALKNNGKTNGVFDSLWFTPQCVITCNQKPALWRWANLSYASLKVLKWKQLFGTRGNWFQFQKHYFCVHLFSLQIESLRGVTFY